MSKVGKIPWMPPALWSYKWWNNTWHLRASSSCCSVTYHSSLALLRSGCLGIWHYRESCIPVPLGSIRSILPESVNNLLQQARPHLNSWCSDSVCWNAHRPLLFPCSWNHQCGSSYPYVLQTMHQCTTLYFLTCRLKQSVVSQWFLVFTSSPLSDYFSHQCQAFSI